MLPIAAQYGMAHGGVVNGAVALARDLMKGDPATFKQGYSAASAALTACEAFDLDTLDDGGTAGTEKARAAVIAMVTREVKCECGHTYDLTDTWDANPPIPYDSWPERWSATDEGAARATCYSCDADLDALIEALDLPDYPWKVRA